MFVASSKFVLSFICVVQFCIIMYLIIHKSTNDTLCMEQLAEAHSRIEEISSLQNIREAEYAAAVVARMDELQQHAVQS